MSDTPDVREVIARALWAQQVAVDSQDAYYDDADAVLAALTDQGIVLCRRDARYNLPGLAPLADDEIR